MTEVELRIAIAEIDSKMSSLSHQRQKLMVQFTVIACPHKVGDRFNKKVTHGHDKNKKEKIELWEVIRISPDNSFRYWNIVGKHVLKDGSLAQLERRMFLDFGLDTFEKVNKE